MDHERSPYDSRWHDAFGAARNDAQWHDADHLFAQTANPYERLDVDLHDALGAPAAPPSATTEPQLIDVVGEEPACGHPHSFAAPQYAASNDYSRTTNPARPHNLNTVQGHFAYGTSPMPQFVAHDHMYPYHQPPANAQVVNTKFIDFGGQAPMVHHPQAYAAAFPPGAHVDARFVPSEVGARGHMTTNQRQQAQANARVAYTGTTDFGALAPVPHQQQPYAAVHQPAPAVEAVFMPGGVADPRGLANCRHEANANQFRMTEGAIEPGKRGKTETEPRAAATHLYRTNELTNYGVDIAGYFAPPGLQHRIVKPNRVTRTKDAKCGAGAPGYFAPPGLQRRVVKPEREMRLAQAGGYFAPPGLKRRAFEQRPGKDAHLAAGACVAEGYGVGGYLVTTHLQRREEQIAEIRPFGGKPYFAPPGLKRRGNYAQGLRQTEGAHFAALLRKHRENTLDLPVAEKHVRREVDSESKKDANAGDKPHSVRSISGQPIIRERDLETIRHLASGASGTVYKVRHKVTGANYALKIMDLDGTERRSRASMEESSQVEEEASVRVAGSRWVVNVHQVTRRGGIVKILMELCTRGDLHTFLRKHGDKITFAQRRQLVAEIVLQLEYIHSRGVVHRDVKPDNILITDEGHLKLTDFDLAHTNMGFKPKDARFYGGTLKYMSPEVAQGIEHNLAVDWWALGCIFYEIFVGCTPFEFAGESDAQLIDRAIYDQVVSSAHFSSEPEAFDLIENLLEKDPADRLGGSGAEDVKTHPYFHGFDWDALASGAMAGMPDAFH